MDMTDTIIPNSDQLNADDLMAGPRVVTIAEVVRGGSAEQPVDIHLAEFPGRPFRPSKSMRRVLVAAWGVQSSSYLGRRLTIYRDPDVMFGRDRVGGIRISHMSHIDKPLKVALTVTRGKRAPWVVEPLREVPARDWHAEADALTDIDALKALWHEAPVSERDYITARAASLRAESVAPEAQDDDGPMIPGADS